MYASSLDRLPQHALLSLQALRDEMNTCESQRWCQPAPAGTRIFQIREWEGAFCAGAPQEFRRFANTTNTNGQDVSESLSPKGGSQKGDRKKASWCCVWVDRLKWRSSDISWSGPPLRIPFVGWRASLPTSLRICYLKWAVGLRMMTWTTRREFRIGLSQCWDKQSAILLASSLDMAMCQTCVDGCNFTYQGAAPRQKCSIPSFARCFSPCPILCTLAGCEKLWRVAAPSKVTKARPSQAKSSQARSECQPAAKRSNYQQIPTTANGRRHTRGRSGTWRTLRVCLRRAISVRFYVCLDWVVLSWYIIIYSMYISYIVYAMLRYAGMCCVVCCCVVYYCVVSCYDMLCCVMLHPFAPDITKY